MAVRSAEYWARRAESRLASVERGSERFLNQIRLNQARVAAQIREDIDVILGNFARHGDLTIEQAQQILSSPISAADRARLLDIAQMITDERERARLMSIVNAPAYKARINRLEAIGYAAEGRMSAMLPEQLSLITQDLRRAGPEMYLKTMFDLQRGIGLGFSFQMVTDRQIEAVITHNWSGAHYSQRIWRSSDMVAAEVRDTVQQNMTTGRSWRRSLDEVQRFAYNQGTFDAQRLLRTETAYVAAEMEAQAYQEAGLDEYRYLATLDTRTSQVCRELDGKRFKLKDKATGVNFPPMHPFCRSTTVAVIDGFDVSRLSRRARDPNTGETFLVPATMTYRNWERRYAPRAVKPVKAG